MTEAELNAAVREAFAYAARYVSQIVAAAPQSATWVAGRPDVHAVLQQALDQAREIAEEAVRQAWFTHGGTPGEYLTWLLADVARSYEQRENLDDAIRYGWDQVPGYGLAWATGKARAEAVKQAILDVGEQVALRNELTLHGAQAGARTHAALAEAEERLALGTRVWKQWLCSSDPPDPKTCYWCRRLHGVIVELHDNFPIAPPTDLTGHGRLTRPPAPYRGVLPGPPRHPRCRCRLKILYGLGEPEPTTKGDDSSFLAAEQIRAMPEDRYQGLVHFLEAAVHELRQVLGRLGRAARGEDA